MNFEPPRYVLNVSPFYLYYPSLFWGFDFALLSGNFLKLYITNYYNGLYQCSFCYLPLLKFFPSRLFSPCSFSLSVCSLWSFFFLLLDFHSVLWFFFLLRYTWHIALYFQVYNIMIEWEMVTTISLVNIHLHTVTNFFLVIRAFKIYSLSNFRIYRTVLLTVVTVLCLLILNCLFIFMNKGLSWLQ